MRILSNYMGFVTGHGKRVRSQQGPERGRGYVHGASKASKHACVSMLLISWIMADGTPEVTNVKLINGDVCWGHTGRMVVL